ncbi:MAG: hypothetical protein HPY84_15240 [Syntrophobacteraceae bacterium]|jgi:hypothetical protein|nr:hypothetical protein [Syntrophobacteraceae bacterium]
MRAFKICVGCLAAIVVMAWNMPSLQAQGEPRKVKVKVEMKKGDAVTFFYGGSTDIREVFPVGETMGVYARDRAFGLNENVRMGKVRITGYAGDNYIKAEVVEGRIGPGDVVKLKPGPGAAGMVVPPLPQK